MSSSYEEEEFDSNLRETFMIGFLHAIALFVSLAMVFPKSLSTTDQVFSKLLTSVCLCFAQTNLCIVPLNEFIYCFPTIPQWLGIDGHRFTNHFALTSSVGGRFCLFVLNPYSCLLQESSMTGVHTARSIATAWMELVLLLGMAVCGGMVYLYSLNGGGGWVGLYSMAVHLPGWCMFLTAAPAALVGFLSHAMDQFAIAPSPTTAASDTPSSELDQRELDQMYAWAGRREEVVLPPESSSGWQNLVALFRLFLLVFLTLAMVLRMVLPPKVTYYLFQGSRVLKVCPQLYFLFAAYHHYHRTIEEELGSFTYTSKLLVFALSAPLVLASLFGLFDILPRKSCGPSFLPQSRAYCCEFFSFLPHHRGLYTINVGSELWLSLPAQKQTRKPAPASKLLLQPPSSSSNTALRGFLRTGEEPEHDLWWQPHHALEFVSVSAAVNSASLERFVARTVLFRTIFTRLRQRTTEIKVSIPIVLCPDSSSLVLEERHIVQYGNVLDWPKSMYEDIISKRLVVVTACFTEIGDRRPSLLSSTPMSLTSMGSVSLVEQIVQSSQQGSRLTMEDFYVKEAFDEFKLFAVFDGHCGTWAAERCAQLFPSVFERYLDKTDYDFEKSLKRTVAKLEDSILRELSPKTKEDFMESEEQAITRLAGSCLCVCVCTDTELFVANLGDSRAVLCTQGKSRLLTPFDHNMDNCHEVARVVREGGIVIDKRVVGLTKGKYSSLSISRSIGDLDFVDETRVFTKAIGISSVPDVFTYSLNSELDEFIILACDGLWEVMSQDLACCLVRQSLKRSKGDLQKAADELVRTAIAAFSTDNVTVILAALPAVSKIWIPSPSTSSPICTTPEEEASERERPRFNFGGLKKMIV
ncbi:hypothetical protein BASA81_009131 [Batrachochytrium salamandrivorans]|nr:hypothetical protein BASA81_009131 [Batrachochytrium salamandrivorans]